jgi:RNA 2',3'-cyclic 3'-phosphodiesterase
MARDRAARPEAKPLRLFVAVDVPRSAKDHLATAIAPFRDRVPARWTGSDGWHVTLKFLGTTWPRLVDTVRDAVTSTAQQAVPFESSLTEVGVFPSPGRARVVWAGLTDPDECLGRLASSLDEVLAEDFTPETRAFTPHLTLARLNPPRNIREFAPDLVGLSVESDPFPVDRLVLYRSHLSPRGASYEAVLTAALGGQRSPAVGPAPAE